MVHTGYLSKEGSFFKSWKLRYFVLTPQGIGDKAVLNYYENDSMRSLKGGIDVNRESSTKILELKDTPGQSVGFPFSILTKSRELKVIAQSERDRIVWVGKLDDIIKFHDNKAIAREKLTLINTNLKKFIYAELISLHSDMKDEQVDSYLLVMHDIGIKTISDYVYSAPMEFKEALDAHPSASTDCKKDLKTLLTLIKVKFDAADKTDKLRRMSIRVASEATDANVDDLEALPPPPPVHLSPSYRFATSPIHSERPPPPPALPPPNDHPVVLGEDEQNLIHSETNDSSGSCGSQGGQGEGDSQEHLYVKRTSLDGNQKLSIADENKSETDSGGANHAKPEPVVPLVASNSSDLSPAEPLGKQQKVRTFADIAKGIIKMAETEKIKEQVKEQVKEEVKGEVHKEITEMNQKHTEVINEQLKDLGVTALKYIPLSELRKEMDELMAKLNNGENFDDKRFDYLLKCMNVNPEYRKEKAAEAMLWREEVDPLFKGWYESVKKIVPPTINTMTVNDLQGLGFSKALAGRLITKKCLWLVRMHPAMISKLHISDLRGKYNYESNGLDLQEMVAILKALPEKFQEAAGGDKTKWKDNLESKIRELYGKYRQNTLPKTLMKNPAYTPPPSDSIQYDEGFIDFNATIIVQQPSASVAASSDTSTEIGGLTNQPAQDATIVVAPKQNSEVPVDASKSAQPARPNPFGGGGRGGLSLQDALKKSKKFQIVDDDPLSSPSPTPADGQKNIIVSPKSNPMGGGLLDQLKARQKSENDESDSHSKVQPPENEAAAASKSNSVTEEVAAATKLQASFRGASTRKLLIDELQDDASPLSKPSARPNPFGGGLSLQDALKARFEAKQVKEAADAKIKADAQSSN